jgi:hypothetical protein
MLNLLTVHLEAIFIENNVFRKYEIYVGKDLFETWMITTANGRIGTSGKLRNYSFDSFEELQKKLHQLLKKRQSAHKRIGTDYKVTAFSFASTPIGHQLFHTLNLNSQKNQMPL